MFEETVPPRNCYLVTENHGSSQELAGFPGYNCLVFRDLYREDSAFNMATLCLKLVPSRVVISIGRHGSSDIKICFHLEGRDYFVTDFDTSQNYEQQRLRDVTFRCSFCSLKLKSSSKPFCSMY